MATRKPRGIAASALADTHTLLSVTLQTPPEMQVVTLSCLASLSKAVRLASMPVWRELCAARWPSSNSLADLDINQPRAWRAFALARSTAGEESPSAIQRAWVGAAQWNNDLAPFFAQQKPLLLLDVFVQQETAIFSARLSANELDNLLHFSVPGCVDGIVADDEEAAEEFAEAHQYLHVTADTLPSFPQRLLMLLSRGLNQLDDGVWVLQDAEDLELWSKEGQAPLITAQLCLMLAPDKITILHLGAPTCDSDVSGCNLYALGEPELPWQELPFGMLRWARTIVAGEPGHRSGPGLDVILNLYCLGTKVVDGAVADVAKAHAAPTAAQDLSSELPESDVSGGEEAVHEVAEARQKRLQRLRDAIRTLDAERAVLHRQLNECMTGSGGAGGNDSDLDDVADEEKDSDLDLAPSPRCSDSSQQTRTTASDASSDSAGGGVLTKCMRLALASLSVGWLPADGVGEALLRRRREAWATRHDLPFTELDDERELSEGEEDAVLKAEAEHLWDQLDALMPWLSVDGGNDDVSPSF